MGNDWIRCGRRHWPPELTVSSVFVTRSVTCSVKCAVMGGGANRPCIIQQFPNNLIAKICRIIFFLTQLLMLNKITVSISV